MHPSILQAVQIQGVNTGLFTRALEGVTDQEGARTVVPGANTLLWIAAHLVTVRTLMARTVGLEREVPWGGAYGRGAAAVPGQDLPPVAEVLAQWGAVSEALMTRFEKLTEAELGMPVGGFPSVDQTVRGALAMAALHDSYHVGQMGLVRRALGHERLVG